MINLLRAAWRYRVSAVSISLLLMSLLAVAVFLVPAQYDSTAQLLVRPNPQVAAAAPTGLTAQGVAPGESAAHSRGQGLPLQNPRHALVLSVKDLICSREMQQRVVDTVGVDRILKPQGRFALLLDRAVKSLPRDWLHSLAGDETWGLSDAAYRAQIRREQAIIQLSKAVNIEVHRDSQVIWLRTRTGDPFLSRDLMRAFVNEYPRIHAEAFVPTGRLDLFESQVSDAQQRARGASIALRDAKTKRGIVDLDSERAALSERIGLVKREVVITQSEIVATRAELAQLKNDGNLAENAEYEPDLIAQLSVSARLAGLRSKRRWLAGQLDELLQQVTQLNSDAVDVLQLTWEASSAQSQYQRAIEARNAVADVDQAGGYYRSEIAVIHPASLQFQNASPARLPLLAIGALLALTIGIGQAIGRQMLEVRPVVPLGARHDDWYFGDDDGHEPPAATVESGPAKMLNLPR